MSEIMVDPGWWTAVGTSVLHLRQEDGVAMCGRVLYWLEIQIESKMTDRCGYCRWGEYRAG